MRDFTEYASYNTHSIGEARKRLNAATAEAPALPVATQLHVREAPGDVRNTGGGWRSIGEIASVYVNKLKEQRDVRDHQEKEES